MKVMRINERIDRLKQGEKTAGDNCSEMGIFTAKDSMRTQTSFFLPLVQF